MRQIISLFALFLVFGLAGTACKKDDDPSNRDYLLGGEWRIQHIRVDPAIDLNGIPVSIIPLDLDGCESDDYWVFQDGGSIQINEGPTKCDPADPDTYIGGTWALTNNEGTITIDIDGEAITFEVSVISNAEMQLRFLDISVLDEDLPMTSDYWLVFANIK